MNASDICLSLIKQSEGLSLSAYYCPAGKLTIGYGHTGADVHKNDSINEGVANDLLKGDVAPVEKWLNGCNMTFTQGQFDALVSFAYNLGCRTLGNSTLWKLVCAKEYEHAADEFHKWVHCGEAVLPGLVKRRDRERQMFMTGEWK